MAKRYDFFYRLLVEEQHLDNAFGALELADQKIIGDLGIVGIVKEAAVSQHSPTPNLSVDVSGSAAIFDQSGQRIPIPSLQTVDLSADSNNVSTSVATPGNEKWVSLFAKFTRTLSDPQVDGNNNTVYFERDEAVMFVKVQGAEAAIGAAVRPSLLSDGILLADVQRTQGQTQILTANISTTRRQDAVVLSVGSMSVRAGTYLASDLAILTYLNAHVTNGSGAHAASAISYAGGGNWANGATNPTTTVESQFDSMLSVLAATTSGLSGMHHIGIANSSAFYDGTNITGTTAFNTVDGIITRLASSTTSSSAPRKIGCEARSAWLGGRTNPASSLFAAIDKIITDLGVTTVGDDGLERIGAAASGHLSTGSGRSQIDELDARAPFVHADAYVYATQDGVIDAHSGSTGGWTNSSLSKSLTLTTGQKVLVTATFGISGTPTGAYSLRLAASGTAIDGTACGAEIRNALTLNGFFTAPSGGSYTFTMQFNNPSSPMAGMNVVGAASLIAIPVY